MNYCQICNQPLPIEAARCIRCNGLTSINVIPSENFIKEFYELPKSEAIEVMLKGLGIE